MNDYGAVLFTLAEMTEAAIHIIELNGARHAVCLAGDISAPALVLLHVWPKTSLSWTSVMAPLAAHYRVVAPDLRGLGDNAPIAGGYAKVDQARDLAALLNALRIASAHFVGHDMGATIIYPFARLFPERTRSLTFIEVPPLGLSALSILQRHWRRAF